MSERKTSGLSRISSLLQQEAMNPRRGSMFDFMFLIRKSSTRKWKRSPRMLKQEGDATAGHSQGQEMEEDDRNMSKDQLLAKIREKKEVIEKLKCQPWPMKRKRRTLKVAQKYLQKHEPKVSRTHVVKQSFLRRWKDLRRFFWNFCTYLIPWESKIKGIESRFGSVVSSYFTFLRWILALNFVISFVICVFVVLPEVLADSLTSRLDDENKTSLYIHRKFLTEEKERTASQLQVVFDFKGRIAKSPLFYGYFSNETWLLDEFRYRLPLTYFLVNIALFGFSFFVILKKMAANARANKMSGGKTEQYPFSWKVFTGWDYMIGVAETAANAMMANVMKFRESMTGHREKQKEKFQWLLFFRRILANCIITCMIGLSIYLIQNAVFRSVDIESDVNASGFAKNEVPIVVSVITLVYPNIFELISNFLERFHPRTALRLQLARILALYLMNFYTLIFALMHKMKQYKKMQEEAYNQSLMQQLDSSNRFNSSVLSDSIPSADYYDYLDADYYDLGAGNSDYADYAQNYDVTTHALIEAAVSLLNFSLSNATFFTYDSLPLGSWLPLAALVARLARSDQSSESYSNLSRNGGTFRGRSDLRRRRRDYVVDGDDEDDDDDDDGGDSSRSFDDDDAATPSTVRLDIDGFLKNLRRIQRDFVETYDRARTKATTTKSTFKSSRRGSRARDYSEAQRDYSKTRDDDLSRRRMFRNYTSRHDATTTTTSRSSRRRNHVGATTSKSAWNRIRNRTRILIRNTLMTSTKNPSDFGPDFYSPRHYDPLIEISALLQRIVRAYANGFDPDAATATAEDRGDATASPVSLSTVDPVYGPIAIENVLAILKNNVTDEDLRNMLLLEIRRKNGEKSSRANDSSRGSPPSATPRSTAPTSSTPRHKTSPVVVPIFGIILAKISRAIKGMPPEAIRRYYQSRFRKNNRTKTPTSSSSNRINDHKSSNELNDTLALIEKQGERGVGLPAIPGITDARPHRHHTGKDKPLLERKDEVNRFRGRTSKLTKEDYEFLCWENMIGQEVCKLTTVDLFMTVAAILFVDFFRGLWVRYCSRWWCWNLETIFPEYGEFKVAENVLHLINNQGMIWLGVFFAPLLPLLNNVKIIIVLYLRAWAVVTCNVPAAQIFRASKSSNFYLTLVLLMLFLCSLPVGFFIATEAPSAICGPFGGKRRFYSVITDELPAQIYNNITHLSSPGIVIPVFVLLVLVVYFLISLVRGLREANNDLQKQLVHERTEEKRKVYRMAGKGRYGGSERGSMALPEKHRIDQGHLPDEERYRRETWHAPRGERASREASLSSPDSGTATDSLRPQATGRTPSLLPEPFAPAYRRLSKPNDLNVQESDYDVLKQAAKLHHTTTEKPLFFLPYYTPSLKTLPEELGQSSLDQSSLADTPRTYTPKEEPLVMWKSVKETYLTETTETKTPDSSTLDSKILPITAAGEPSTSEYASIPPSLQLIDLRQSPRRSESRTEPEITTNGISAPTRKSVSPARKLPISQYDVDTDIDRYDSGRATMDERGSSSGYNLQQPTTSSATEPDTGTESETGRLIRRPPKLSMPGSKLIIPVMSSATEDDDDDDETETTGLLKRTPRRPIKSDDRTLLSKFAAASRFSPWPPPASATQSDVRSQRSKVVGARSPDSRVAPTTLTSIPALSAPMVDDSQKTASYSSSVIQIGSPEPGEEPASPKTYPAGQSFSRTPSPDATHPAASPVNMSQSACEPLMPTRLSVIDEGLPATDRRLIPRPRKRSGVHFSPTKQKDFIFFDSADRIAAASRPSNSRTLSEQELPEQSRSGSTSKETMI